MCYFRVCFANISFLGSTFAAASSAYTRTAICGKKEPCMHFRKSPQLVNSAINVSDKSSLIFETALRLSKQPYICSKEPYKSLKEPYITKGALNLQKSPTFSKKPYISSKELCIFKRALHLQNSLTSSKLPYIFKRVIHIFKRTLNLSKEPYTSCKEPYVVKRDPHVFERVAK